MARRRSVPPWYFLIVLISLFNITIAHAQTTISTDITADAIWNLAGSPYIINKDIIISSAATLTIGPGVVVKFHSYTNDFLVAGTLNANGTSSQPVLFTEIRDDTGGDSNGDGSGSSPYPGNWG